jgi:hypothetical protein
MEAQFLDRVYDELTTEAENRRLGASSNPAFYGELGKGQINALVFRIPCKPTNPETVCFLGDERGRSESFILGFTE